jgi:hypothetical protein
LPREERDLHWIAVAPVVAVAASRTGAGHGHGHDGQDGGGARRALPPQQAAAPPHVAQCVYRTTRFGVLLRAAGGDSALLLRIEESMLSCFKAYPNVHRIYCWQVIISRKIISAEPSHYYITN